MISEREIQRFRHNIPCPLPRMCCMWVERDNGDVQCENCGSGYRKESRRVLRELYEDC